MNWIITEDRIHASKVANLLGRTAARNLGAAGIAPYLAEHAAILVDNFRLLDDDGEVYFIGRCEDLGQLDGDTAFEPLDMIGHVYGCTTMQYRRHASAKWETL